MEIHKTTELSQEINAESEKNIENPNYLNEITDNIMFPYKEHESLRNDNQESSVIINESKLTVSKAHMDYLNLGSTPDEINISSNTSQIYNNNKVVYKKIKDSLLCYKSKYDNGTRQKSSVSTGH